MPPFVGVAVKFTAVLLQTVVASAAITTDGVTLAETVMVIPLLVAVELVAQAALLVNCNVMMSPFNKPLSE